MYREYVPSARNSSYSFRPILFKLYRLCQDGLKICILFFQNPEIIFYYIFCIFNLDFFRARILQKCIGCMYLLPATPPTVLGQSFSNFTGAFRMVGRYAYSFFRILKLFFTTFFAFLTSTFFFSPNTTGMYREYVPSARNSSYSFRPILFKLYRCF